jgi:radical SAM superfamily enzyme YgiQ (UPF0313 family)
MFSILPSLYPRRLKAITPKKHTVTLLNERYHHISFDTSFQLVVIHFNTASAYRAYDIADTFRKKRIPVILCGLHASALPKEALEHADGVLLGRGEGNWLKLLNDCENGRLDKIYPPEPYDQIPCSIPHTHVVLPSFQLTGAIEATRGCPYQCSFCPEANTPDGHRFFVRPVDEVIEEIRSIPQRTIMFYDLSLTINVAYTKELFEKMRPLKKKFFCNGNVDVLSSDEELVRLSYEAGCIAWLIGFESFSQQTISSIGKTTNSVSTYKKAIDLIHHHNMAVIGDFMFGFDTDTRDVFETTLTMLKTLNIDVADFSILTPFPGTPLFHDLDMAGRIITKDWAKYTMHSVVFQPKHMTPDEIFHGVRYMYKEFYSPINVIKRIFRGATYGFFPFSLLLGRNIITSFNKRNLTVSKKASSITK